MLRFAASPKNIWKTSCTEFTKLFLSKVAQEQQAKRDEKAGKKQSAAAGMLNRSLEHFQRAAKSQVMDTLKRLGKAKKSSEPATFWRLLCRFSNSTREMARHAQAKHAENWRKPSSGLFQKTKWTGTANASTGRQKSQRSSTNGDCWPPNKGARKSKAKP